MSASGFRRCSADGDDSRSRKRSRAARALPSRSPLRRPISRRRRPPRLRDAMTTAMIAEDEPMMRAQLKGRLAQAWPELEIVGVAQNGEEALALADEKRP